MGMGRYDSEFSYDSIFSKLAHMRNAADVSEDTGPVSNTKKLIVEAVPKLPGLDEVVAADGVTHELCWVDEFTDVSGRLEARILHEHLVEVRYGDIAHITAATEDCVSRVAEILLPLRFKVSSAADLRKADKRPGLVYLLNAFASAVLFFLVWAFAGDMILLILPTLAFVVCFALWLSDIYPPGKKLARQPKRVVCLECSRPSEFCCCRLLRVVCLECSRPSEFCGCSLCEFLDSPPERGFWSSAR